MKILILGNSGCGKSTLATKLAKELNLPCCHMDDIIWNNGAKREQSERKELLNDFLNTNQSWIIEGMSHSEWMQSTFDLCDYIFLLKISGFRAWLRIYKRFLKKKLGIEKGHKENLKYLRTMHKVRRKYEKTTIHEIQQKMEERKQKSFIVHKYNDVIKILQNKI